MSINEEAARNALLSLQLEIGVVHNTATQI
jgi:hypothetical protein